MTQSGINQDLIEKTIHFHGHSCPGLALGIRAAEIALAEFGRASDEEIVAVVETDNCGVDAIQFITGCTFGKGNLIHLDYGKRAFSFYRRSDKKAIRIVQRPEFFQEASDEQRTGREKMAGEGQRPDDQERMKEAREARIKRIMEARLEDLFEVKQAQHPLPQKARVLDSLNCQACGEATMESRTRRFQGQTLCLPCFEAKEKGC